MTSNTADMLGKRLLAARRDAPDFRDFVYRPALIALRPELPVPPGLHIRDQGSSAACTGFGLAAVIDRLLARSGGHSAETAVSARMLYEMALRHDEWAGEDDAGSSCRGVIKGWYNMGVCREALYPFDRKPGRSWSIEAAKDARSCTVGAYYRLGSRISDYHAALNEVGSILCSATLHDGWKKPDRETGRIARGQASRGGHAFAIVGYDRNGTYGHPDHKQVHRLAHAVAEPLQADWVLEATYNRDQLAQLPDADGTIDPAFAAGEAELTHFVRGDAWFQAKMTALMNHHSQVPDDVDLDNPDPERYRGRFGTEWFIVSPVNGATDLGLLTTVLELKP